MAENYQHTVQQHIDSQDQEVKKLLNQLVMSSVEEVDWPADNEPKFYKKNLKIIRSGYNT